MTDGLLIGGPCRGERRDAPRGRTAIRVVEREPLSLLDPSARGPGVTATQAVTTRTHVYRRLELRDGEDRSTHALWVHEDLCPSGRPPSLTMVLGELLGAYERDSLYEREDEEDEFTSGYENRHGDHGDET